MEAIKVIVKGCVAVVMYLFFLLFPINLGYQYGLLPLALDIGKGWYTIIVALSLLLLLLLLLAYIVLCGFFVYWTFKGCYFIFDILKCLKMNKRISAIPGLEEYLRHVKMFFRGKNAYTLAIKNGAMLRTSKGWFLIIDNQLVYAEKNPKRKNPPYPENPSHAVSLKTNDRFAIVVYEFIGGWGDEAGECYYGWVLDHEWKLLGRDSYYNTYFGNPGRLQVTESGIMVSRMEEGSKGHPIFERTLIDLRFNREGKFIKEATRKEA